MIEPGITAVFFQLMGLVAIIFIVIYLIISYSETVKNYKLKKERLQHISNLEIPKWKYKDELKLIYQDDTFLFLGKTEDSVISLKEGEYIEIPFNRIKLNLSLQAREKEQRQEHLKILSQNFKEIYSDLQTEE